jgi:quercetin dioxygenase-like cupin family protein
MAVRVVEIDNIEWQSAPRTWPGKAADGEPDVRYKPFSTGAHAAPAGQLIEFEAGHVEAPHSHAESEIFFVLSGGLQIGDAEVTAGMLVHIDGGTVYGPRAPAGCRFLRLSLAD